MNFSPDYKLIFFIYILLLYEYHFFHALALILNILYLLRKIIYFSILFIFIIFCIIFYWLQFFYLSLHLFHLSQHQFFHFSSFWYFFSFFYIFPLYGWLSNILHDWFHSFNVINDLDVNVSILLNLLLANITILLCFFLFLVVCNSLFMIPVVKENARLKLALNISSGAPITVAKEKNTYSTTC